MRQCKYFKKHTLSGVPDLSHVNAVMAGTALTSQPSLTVAPVDAVRGAESKVITGLSAMGMQ